MGIQSRITQLGIAKQTAKGTPATTPEATIGLTGGQAFDFTYDQKELDTTWSTRGVEAYDRISMVGAVKADAVAMPSSIALLLLLACGTDVVTGSGPYTHTITPANSLPWATFFTLFGTEKQVISDGKVDDLELAFTSTGALSVKITAMGQTWNPYSTWAVAAPERAQGNLLKGVGGVFTVNGVTARVESGSIKISNKLVPVIAAYSTTPDDIFESQFTVATSLVVVPDDLSLFRAAVSGSPTAPALATAATGGTVAAGTYLVAVSYILASGETVISETSSITTTGSTSTITVTSPVQMYGATAYSVYISAVNGTTVTKQGTTTAIGSAFVLTAPPSAGTAPTGGVDSLPPYGALDLKFLIAGTSSLEFQANAVAFMVQYPTSSPAGGPAKLTVTGNACVTSAGAVPCTFIAINNTASY